MALLQGVGRMSKTERQKGLRGQQEVHRLFRTLGIDLDKLAGQGDRVWYVKNGDAIRLEIKNQKRKQIDMWVDQSEAETPATMTPAVVWRRRDGRWRLDIDLEDAIGLVT